MSINGWLGGYSKQECLVQDARMPFAQVTLSQSITMPKSGLHMASSYTCYRRLDRQQCSAAWWLRSLRVITQVVNKANHSISIYCRIPLFSLKVPTPFPKLLTYSPTCSKPTSIAIAIAISQCPPAYATLNPSRTRRYSSDLIL
jgi:hypothetical protein